MNQTIEDCSARLYEAEQQKTRIAPLSDSLPSLSEREAYAIAARTCERRGRRRIGFKLGFTSAAMREQMQVAGPNFGILTEDLLIPEGTGRVDGDNLVHPMVEPEIALLVGRDLQGPGHTRSSVFSSVDAALPSLEVCDTRYESYRFRAVDNIADNSSSARVVLGPPRSMKGPDDLRLCGVQLWSGGVAIDQGVGADALGDPLIALAWLVNKMAEDEVSIPAGSVVLTGGLTRGYAAVRGDGFLAEFAQLGSVFACF